MEATIQKNNKTDMPCLPKQVIWFNRVALFIILFWFGILKILQLSPAETLITHLHEITIIKFISIEKFLFILGVAECFIGFFWLIPRLTKYVMIIFLVQMLTTFLPLMILPKETWDNILVLSLSGQYILKNIVLIASAFTIYYDCRVRGWVLFSF